MSKTQTVRRVFAAGLARRLAAVKPAHTAPIALIFFAVTIASFVLFLAVAVSGNGGVPGSLSRGVSQGWSLGADWGAKLWLDTDPPIPLTQLPREYRGQAGSIDVFHGLRHADNGVLAPILKHERRRISISLGQTKLTSKQLRDIRAGLREHEGQLPPALRAALRAGDGSVWRPIAPSTPVEFLSWAVLLNWWAFIAVAALTVFLWLGGRWTIERIVLRLGYCPNCCYPRDGLAGMQCPECGHWTRRVNRAALLRSPPICPSPSPPNPSSSPAPPPA